MDDDFANSLCDSESERESESEASWDSKAEVSGTDFGLEICRTSLHTRPCDDFWHGKTCSNVDFRADKKVHMQFLVPHLAGPWYTFVPVMMFWQCTACPNV